MVIETISATTCHILPIFKFRLGDQTEVYDIKNKNNRQWKKTSKYKKLNTSATTGKIYT